MPRGHDRALYILPLDHRGLFQTKTFGWKSPPSKMQAAEISRAKEVIYDGFSAALAGGLPKETIGILFDEQFGAAILHDASSKNIITACAAEKSGQEEFDFESIRSLRAISQVAPFSGIRWSGWRNKKATREQTVAAIATRYREFADLFERANTLLCSEFSDRARSRHHSSKEA